MHPKSDNIVILINDEADVFIKNFFDSLKNRYQNNLDSMKGSEFVCDYVQLFYYKCYKMNLNRSGSYIDSPNWIKTKKTTTNTIYKKDNKCFQYAVIVTLNFLKNQKRSTNNNKN